MKQDYSTDNIREYKNLVKLTRKLIKIDKKVVFKEKLEKNINNPKELWKLTKDKLYGNKHKNIEKMMENDKFVNGSANVSNVLNRFFIRKGKKIVENLNDNLIDPMKYYNKKSCTKCG